MFINLLCDQFNPDGEGIYFIYESRSLPVSRTRIYDFLYLIEHDVSGYRISDYYIGYENSSYINYIGFWTARVDGDTLPDKVWLVSFSVFASFSLYTDYEEVKKVCMRRGLMDSKGVILNKNNKMYDIRIVEIQLDNCIKIGIEDIVSAKQLYYLVEDDTGKCFGWSDNLNLLRNLDENGFHTGNIFLRNSDVSLKNIRFGDGSKLNTTEITDKMVTKIKLLH